MEAIRNPAGMLRAPLPAAKALGAGPRGESRLMRFNDRYAGLVASWVGSDRELTWLAPSIVPPLTAAKVCAWGEAGGERLLFWGSGSDEPVGYGELHRMPRSLDQWWIGHVIVDPGRRGVGLGRGFVRHLLARAFGALAAREVLLLVFPENRAAIRCYERSGFLITGMERRYFKGPGLGHWFLRMVVTRSRFRSWDSMTGRAPSVKSPAV